MSKKLIVLMLSLGFSSLNAFSCDLENYSTLNHDYFAYEVSKINNSSGEVYESVPSFLRTRIDETLLNNNYSNHEDALRYLNSTLAYLSINNGLKEAYSGATDDFVVQFLKRYDKVSYCEFSDLLSEYFLVK